MLEIKTNDLISLNEQIQHITVIIYDQYSLPDIQTIIDQPIFFEDKLLLYRNNNKYQSYKKRKAKQQRALNRKYSMEDANMTSKQLIKNDGYFYLIMQVNESNNSEQFMNIEKVIGFADIIIAVQVDRQKQIYLEKNYLEMVNYQILQDQGNSKKYQRNNQLYFVNESYRKSYARKNENIYYCRKIGELDALLSQYYAHQIADLQISSPYGKIDQNLGNQKTGVQNTGFTPNQLVNIFQKSRLISKSTFQIKSALLNYKRLRHYKHDKLNNEKIIFDSIANNDSHSWKFEKNIEKLQLLPKDRQKLLWKNRQIYHYKQLLEEQSSNKQLVNRYKTSALFELPETLIILQLKQFHKKWIQNTLRQLKNSFNLIANRRDTKAIQYFRELCEKTMQKTRLCLKSDTLDNSNRIILQQIKQEVSNFIKYHEAVIRQDHFYSGIQFYRKQIGYLWKYERKKYERIGLFVGLIILAFLQDNIIVGLTIATLGLIFSAVNI